MSTPISDFSPDIFEVVFDGEAVENNSIDAKDLARSILALGELVEQARHLVTDIDADVALRVKSGFKPGSFEVGFEISHTFLTDVLTSKNTTAAVNILALLGISGVKGLIQYLLKAKGRKPKDVISVESKESVIVTFDDGENIEIPKKVFDLYNNQKARQAASMFVSPLEEEGIEKMILRYQGQESIIEEEDRIYFNTDIEDERKIEEDSEKFLVLINVSFKMGQKWRVSDGTDVFYTRILDEAFMNKVISRKILFGTNDSLRVILRTVQILNKDGSLKTFKDVVKVIEHIPSDQQSELDL